MDLIIDTSSEKLRVILNDNNKIFESEESNSKHLKHLLPEIDKILLNASCKLNDIDNFCVVLGPGSFTGVRIGVSTIKAFACALQSKKYIGINMLELLSYTISKKQNFQSDFCIIINSTSTKYYFGLSDNKGNIKKMELITKEELSNFIEKQPKPIFYYNNEFMINNKLCSKIELLTEDFINFVNYKKINKNFIKINDLKPIYLALSQAEEELNKRLLNANKNS